MDKSDIALKKAIVHIMDSSIGMPVLSDMQLDFGSDFGDVLREHIYKVASGDDVKNCRFMDESRVWELVKEYKENAEAQGAFEYFSQQLGGILYEIMNGNIDIPAADLVVVQYRSNQNDYIAILKMNYKSYYTHMTGSDETGNCNSIVPYKAILPGQGQRLTEAAVIDLETEKIQLIEKKYEVNGAKEFYFSQRFLQCTTRLSSKAKLAIVTKAVESVHKELLLESEQCEESMKAKAVIHQEMEEQGEISVPQIAEKIFENRVECRERFQEKMEKYHMEEAVIQPQNETTTRKFQKQCLVTDSGIEIKIPMEQYQSGDAVEFITNSDGTISVLLKNIGNIQSK